MTGNKGLVDSTAEDTSSSAGGLPGLVRTIRRKNRAFRVLSMTIVSALLLSLAGMAFVRGSSRDTISVAITTTTQIKDQSSRRLLTERHAQQQQQQPRRTTRVGTFKVIERFPHDSNAFTQGLQMVNETHYFESLGIYGKSAVRIVKLSTGVPTRETKMGSEYFGEGMCRYTVPGRAGVQRLIQITWQEKEAFIYNSKTLKELGRIPYETSNGEGWGITAAKDVLYVTDGSATLHTWKVPTDGDGTSNSQTIESKTEVQVYKKTRRENRRVAMTNLNELEYDASDGTVLANIWLQDIIVRINPRTGYVKKIYDMSSLYPRSERAPTADVLNGIAKVPGSNSGNEFLITGKKWPWIYRVRFDE